MTVMKGCDGGGCGGDDDGTDHQQGHLDYGRVGMMKDEGGWTHDVGRVVDGVYFVCRSYGNGERGNLKVRGFSLSPVFRARFSQTQLENQRVGLCTCPAMSYTASITWVVLLTSRT
jgi:hypothetical protein